MWSRHGSRSAVDLGLDPLGQLFVKLRVSLEPQILVVNDFLQLTSRKSLALLVHCWPEQRMVWFSLGQAFIHFVLKMWIRR